MSQTSLARWTTAVPFSGRHGHCNNSDNTTRRTKATVTTRKRTTTTVRANDNQNQNPLVTFRHCKHNSRRGVALSAAAAEDPEGGGSEAAAAAQQDEEEEDTAGDIEIPERPTHVRKVDGFLQGTAAEDLRGVFDAHHDDPKRVHEYRFVWDYWHVPGQYTLLRTPAADYFPKEQYDQLVGTEGGEG